MKFMKKLAALTSAIAILATGAASLAATVEPEDTETERLAGATVHATVGDYDAEAGTLTVTLYEEDRFEKDETANLAADDLLLAGGQVHKVKTVGTLDGFQLITCEDGEEIIFMPAKDDDDEVTAQSTDDDRQYMHAFSILKLPAAENITLEDASDPDTAEAIVTRGLEEILKIKAEKEEFNNGLNFYATTITLNASLEIETIHQVFDVAQ